MNYSRRGFLKAMAAMSGSALVAPALSAADDAADAGVTTAAIEAAPSATEVTAAPAAGP